MVAMFEELAGEREDEAGLAWMNQPYPGGVMRGEGERWVIERLMGKGHGHVDD